MTDQTVKKPVPAYTTYRTLMNFVDGLSGAMPPVVDRSIMAKMSGSAQAATLSSLRFLKLIDAKDKPTDLLKRLAGSEGEGRKAALRDIVEGAYGLTDEVDLRTATSGQVEDWFRNQGARGATVSRAFTFFVSMAEDGGIQLSRYLTDHRPKRPNASNGGGGTTGGAAKKKKRSRRKLNLPAEPVIPKGTTKFDVPIPGNTVPASLILPDNLTADDWGMLKQMFDLYAERHIAAGGTDAGDG
jgi:hypothetical protein